MPNSQSQILKGFFLSVAGYFCYSSMDALVKILSVKYSTLLIIFYALACALPLALAFLFIKKTPLQSILPRKPKILLLRSIIAFAATYSAFLSYRYIPIATSYTLIFVCPLILTLLAGIFLKEKLKLSLFVPLITGFFGTLIVLHPGVQGFSVGMVFSLICAFTYAVNMLLLRRYAEEENLIANSLGPQIVSFILSGLLSLADFSLPESSDWPLLAGCGILSILGMSLIAASYCYAPASKIAGAQYSQILWGVLFGYLLWQDIPDRFVAIGGALIIASGLHIIYLNRRTTPPVTDQII